MSLDQRQKISPPQSNDLASLKDFASVVQQAFDDVFQNAHIHNMRTVAPTADEGRSGDIIGVVLSGVGYLYCKFPVIGWKRVALS